MFPIPFNFPFINANGTRTTIGAAINAGGGGSLPTASANVKGGVKIGDGLTMTGEVLSNNNPTPYTLPTASTETKGGVKIGNGLNMTGEALNVDLDVDTTNLTATLKIVDDYAYVASVEMVYIGDAIDGYEIKTFSTSSAAAKIDVFAIKYADATIKSSLHQATLTHNGQNTYSNAYFAIRYSNGSWVVDLNDGVTMYKPDGTTYSDATTWSYDTTVDHLFLEESPV